MTKKEYLELLCRSCHDGTFPSVDPETQLCKYRATHEQGCKQRCAAGLLVPDKMYDPRMEDHTPHAENVRVAILIPDGMDLYELTMAQIVHDEFAGGGKEWDAVAAEAGFRNLNFFKECV